MGLLNRYRMVGNQRDFTSAINVWQVFERYETFGNILQRYFSTSKLARLEVVMSETSLETGQSLTSEQKSAALEAVLHSQTFARADQLKSFLKYVCEMEMAGRGRQLTEYLIAIEALRRPANYSPGDDSAVRTRAFALRKTSIPLNS